MGYRSDIYDILKCADLFFFPSYREGLSVALMEAMAAGLPVICSKIRGNVDLIDKGKGGLLLAPTDVEGFSKALKYVADKPGLMIKMGHYNRLKIANFDVKKVNIDMYKIYSELQM